MTAPSSTAGRVKPLIVILCEVEDGAGAETPASCINEETAAADSSLSNVPLALAEVATADDADAAAVEVAAAAAAGSPEVATADATAASLAAGG